MCAFRREEEGKLRSGVVGLSRCVGLGRRRRAGGEQEGTRRSKLLPTAVPSDTLISRQLGSDYTVAVGKCFYVTLSCGRHFSRTT